MANRTCSVEGCGRELTPPHGRGMCGKHYQKWRKYGDPSHVRPVKCGVAPCAIDGCDGKVKSREWCSKHYTRWVRHGSPTARVRAEVVDGKRICPTCEVDRPLAEWTKGECKMCARKRSDEYRARNPYVPRTIGVRACGHCGLNFPANGNRHRYCSRLCYRAHRNIANWPHLVARRARLRGAFVEKFDRVEIFERDGWACQICSRPIDPDLRFPDPAAASLDHVIPLARGGKHSRANAQASHWICNIRKAASLPGGVVPQFE